MPDNSLQRFSAIVVGGGISGISASYYLKAKGISHVVLEQDEILESWKSKRWDNFKLNTPIERSLLPNQPFDSSLASHTLSRNELFECWSSYAKSCDLPILENSMVLSVEQITDSSNPKDRFSVTYSDKKTQETFTIHGQNIVMCIGQNRIPTIPDDLQKSMPSSIEQFTVGKYTSPDKLPSGATLVIGSGQTGVQISDELVDHGKKVFLATSKVGGVPRSYRGLDLFKLLLEGGSATVEQIPDLENVRQRKFPITGADHAISYETLFARGCTLLGSLERVDGQNLHFQPNLTEHHEFAHAQYANYLGLLQLNFEKRQARLVEEGVDDVAPPSDQEREPEWIQSPDFIKYTESAPTSINMAEHDITSIIWATGFKPDYACLKIDAVKQELHPITNIPTACKSNSVPGFYWLGFPWTRTAHSGIVLGITKDAEIVVTDIAQTN